MRLTFHQPLLWLLVLVALGLGYAFSLVERPTKWKVASFALRALGIVLLVLALCRPVWMRESREAHVQFLLDVSQSVDLAEARKAVDIIDQGIGQLRGGDTHSVFAVANGARSFRETKALAEMLDQWQKGIADDAFRSASKLGETMLATRLDFPAGKARRVVLISDGQDTTDSIADCLRQLREEKIDVQWLKLPGLAKAEAAIAGVETSSPNAFEGEVVRLKINAVSNRDMPAKLRVSHKGVIVQEKAVTLKAGQENSLEVDATMTTPGDSLWTAELEPSEDHFPLNNRYNVTVRVSGKPRVLALHGKPQDMRPFARAMKEQEIDLDIRGTKGLPESLEGLLAFDAIALADIAATDLTPRQMDLLKRYVMDFGGGLAMFGSENSFGLGGYYKTPVEEVIPLVSRFEKEKEKPSLAMCLVLDRSGSMSGLPLELARQAAKAAADLLGPRDQVGVVAFDDQARVYCELRSAAEQDAIQSAIDSIEAGGGTDMFPGMATGKDILDNASAKIKHMIVLTDGQSQENDFIGLTQSLVDAGVTVSTVAMGDGAARELLAAIAETGKGRYYETNDPANVPQIFTKETMQASKSAIKEDLFKTAQSGDHPLLSGYEGGDLPFTLGFVMTEPKPTSQVLLVTETGDPLLALSRYGLGMGLAYTSDLTERWGGEWLAWDGCGKFWAQALRAIVRKADAVGMGVTETIAGDTWKLDITRRDPNQMPVSKIAWDAQMMDADGRAFPLTVKEVGLGRYHVEAPLADREKLSLRLRDKDNDKLKILHYHRPYPKEYALSDKPSPSVAELAAFDLAKLRDGLVPVESRVNLAAPFYLAALVVLLAGLLFRRI